MPTIQFRRGTAVEWFDVNPVLNSGEPGYETDTCLQKIGDGTRHWRDLPYFVDETMAREMVDDVISHSGGVVSDQVSSIKVLSQTEYDAITPADDVLYVVTE